MNEFWIFAGLLLLAVYALFVPILLGNRYHSQAVDRRSYLLWIFRERRKELASEESGTALGMLETELERDLLDAYGTVAPKAADPQLTAPKQGYAAVVAALMIVPAVAIALYLAVGRLDLAVLGRPPQSSAAREPDAGEIQEAIQSLEARLKANPGDAQGWLLLGRSLQATRQMDKAAEAYEKALQLRPDDLNLKALYAEALAELNHGNFSGKPQELIQGILGSDPNHPLGLWLAGLAAAASGNEAEAKTHWHALLVQLDPASDDARQLRAYLEKIGVEQAATPKPTHQDDPSTVARGTGRLRVKVELNANLQSRVAPQDTVFIFARAAEGPPMPLAIVKTLVSKLPVEVELSDEMAMMPGMKLSSFAEITLNARVSKTASATPAPGDLLGSIGPIQPKSSETYTVKIDHVI